MSDTNSRRIYRPALLSGVRDLMGKKSALPPAAKLACTAPGALLEHLLPLLSRLFATAPPLAWSSVAAVEAFARRRQLQVSARFHETNVCLCLQVTEKWWQVRANSVRRSTKRDVETEEKPQRRSSWDPKVEREREFAAKNMSSLL